jgi:Tol biopolymer transport system component/DNA-binding winged helix-turn-helix (wHTH) protein
MHAAPWYNAGRHQHVGARRMVSPDESRHNAVVRFGAFELNPETGELSKLGLPIRLSPQPFKLLSILVSQPGKLVSREELRGQLWNGTTFVNFEQGLNFCVRRIRAVLDDNADRPHFIETVPRRGYRFIAPVESNDGTVNLLPECSIKIAPANGGAVVHPAQVESSELEPATTQIRYTHRKRRFLIVSSVFFAIIGMIVLFREKYAHIESASLLPEPVIVPLISLQGEQSMPAFSPDGSRVAFLWRAPNQAQSGIYAAVVGSQSLVRLSHSGDDYSPAWSPDGREVAFLHDSGEKFLIDSVPALGGNEKNIYTGLLGPLNYNASNYGLSFSANGKLLTFCEWNPSVQGTGIRLLSLSDSSARFLPLPPLGFNDRRPAFSPSGDRIAFVRSSGPIYVDELVVISLTNGRTQQLTFDHKRIFGAPSWTPDGREIIYSSNRAGLANVWRISAVGGTPRPVERVGPIAWFPSVSPAGMQLAYENSDEEQNLWRIQLRDATHARGPASILVSASKTYNLLPQFSPDGNKIAFQTERSGYAEVWICDRDGSNPTQITRLETFAGSPHWSPDGKFLAFDYRPGQHSEIHVVEVGGSHAFPVARFADADNVFPTWSRDGQWIYFASNRGGKTFQVWKVAVRNGFALQSAPVQVTRNGGFATAESADGRFLFYSKASGPGIWKVPVDGGRESAVWPGPGPVNWSNWALAERGVYFFAPRDVAPPEIDFMDFKTKRISHVAPLNKFGFYGFAISSDGKALIYPQSDRTEHDIFVVKNFR